MVRPVADELEQRHFDMALTEWLRLTRNIHSDNTRQERFRNLALLAHGHTRDKVERVIISVDDCRCLKYMACDATT